jgi:WD40 repeat protein/predicted KAP-like P-loop ATPase
MEAPQDLEPTTPEPEKHLAEFKSPVYTLAISPQGRKRVAVGLKDGTIEIWNLLTETKLLSQQGHKSPVWSVAFNHDGSMLVSGGSDRKVRLWDVTSETAITAIDRPSWFHGNYVKSVAFNHDGSMVVSGGDDTRVKLWNVTTGQAIDRPSWFHEDFVKSVAFSPDGGKVVSGGRDNKVRLWDVETGEAIGQPFLGHENYIRSVAFSPDGSMIISSSWERKVRLWDVKTGKAIGQPFLGDADDVRSVAFSPDGSMIVSGSNDNTVRLWDISDPQRKRQIIIGKHKSPVYSVAFDPLEDYIISASTDGIKVWRWQGLNIHRVSQAFSNDQATGKDSLDVTKELESLADVLMLRSLEPPLAVAILGSWGSGKSFGMHLIEKQITKIRCQQLNGKQTWGEQGEEKDLSPYVGHVYQIKFNAWSYAKSDLWASLMQTIFEQLDRQLTLEQQLRDVGENDLAGGDIWGVLNQMSGSDRKALESNFQEVFKKLRGKNVNGNTLWGIFSLVRKEQQEELQNLEIELQQEELKINNKNQINEKQVNKKYHRINIVISFLVQLDKLSKNKDALNFLLKLYGFEDKEDLEKKIPIFNQFNKLNKYQLIKEVGDLIDNENSPKDNPINKILQNHKTVNSFLSQIKIKIIGLWEFCQDQQNLNKLSGIILIILVVILIAYILGFHVLPYILPALKPWIASVIASLTTFLTGIVSIYTLFKDNKNFKEHINFIFKIYKDFQSAKKDTEEIKQKLAAKKDKAIKDAKDKNQQNIESIKVKIEEQKQRVGLSYQYPSLLDFVNNRLEDDSYQKRLGLMNQVQNDLKDLSEHLTYIPAHTNPDKLEVLKKYFPRGPARIVLYIDDLDRCPPDKVVQVLEAVQLLLNTNIFIIVLAIDDRYIGRALEQVYRGVLKRGGTPSGVDYLEKIIQIPYRMRPINKDVTGKYLSSLIDIEDQPQKDQPQKEKITMREDYSQKGHMEFYTYSDKISEPRTKENNNKENDGEKSPNSENPTSLVDCQKFTSEEFEWISECCQHVDLTPRTAKRLVNICKVIKIIWTPAANDKTWKQEPKKEYKQTLIAFLALAGRYPKEMRKLLEEIYLKFEENDEDTIKIPKDEWLNHLQNLDIFMDRHNQREWKKFKNDFRKMPPETEFVFEKRTFNLAVSFCFVGDIGYDPDDNYNREYRFEDRQKQYGFQNP